MSHSVTELRAAADEIEACGGGNEAACMRWAANEIDRLRSAVRTYGDKRRMSFAPADLQHSIDAAFSEDVA